MFEVASLMVAVACTNHSIEPAAIQVVPTPVLIFPTPTSTPEPTASPIPARTSTPTPTPVPTLTPANIKEWRDRKMPNGLRLEIERFERLGEAYTRLNQNFAGRGNFIEFVINFGEDADQETIESIINFLEMAGTDSYLLGNSGIAASVDLIWVRRLYLLPGVQNLFSSPRPSF
jgi:hypothetical protein